MNTVYDPLPTMNRLEALAMRLSGAMGDFEDLVSNSPDMPVEDTFRGTLNHANIQTRLQKYLDDSDPSEPDFLDRIQKASDGIARIRELSPKWIKRREDLRACATYPVLQGILGNTIAAFSDTKDVASRFFVAYYREFGMSEAAQLGMLRNADLLTVSRIAMLSFAKDEAVMKLLGNTNGQNGQILQQIVTMKLEFALGAEDAGAETIRGALGKLDYTRMFLQFTSTLMSTDELHGATFNTAADLIEATAKLKQVFLAVMPYALVDVKYDPDPELTQRVVQLEGDLDGALAAYAAESSGEYLDVREISQIQEQHPEYTSGEIADLERVRNLQFTHVAKPDRIIRDCEEVIIAAQHGAFKLATVGCGGLLESVLREFVHRNKAEVDELRVGPEWGAIFAKKSIYVTEADVLTWDLFTLINVSAFLFSKEDSELASHCHRLRTARNKIHGGGVGKEVCTFAISVIKAVVSYLA